MSHLKQHVFDSEADVCVYCGADLEEAHLPCDHALESAPAGRGIGMTVGGTTMKTHAESRSIELQQFYVDIPTEDCVRNDSGAWHNVGEFDTEAEALAFAEEHFGADGRDRVFLVPSQMDEQRDNVERAAPDTRSRSRHPSSIRGASCGIGVITCLRIIR